MDIGFEGFESSDFETELEDVELKRIKKFDRIWKFSEGGSICYHVLHDNVVYFGAMDGYVYAVNFETGDVIWKFKTGSRNFGSVSNVSEGIICIPCFDKNIYALDAKTGKEIWRFKTGGEIFGSPFMANGKVFVGSKDGYVYAIDLKGKLTWNFKTGDEVACSPTVYKNKVFVGSFDGYMYCLDCESGKEIWRFKSGEEVQFDRPCFLHNNILYFPSFDSYIYAVDIETGKELWRFKTGKFGTSSSPILMNGRLYVGSRDGFVYAITMEGKEIWRFRTGGIVIGMSAHNGRIYLTSEDGNLYVLTEDGKEDWRFKFGEGGSFDFPSFKDGKIIVASMDCHLYVIDENTHKEIWRVQTSSRRPSTAPPPHEEFSMELKKETHIEETIEESKYKKKKEETLSLSDYQIESEYSSESEYKQKSDYNVDLVMFEDVMEVEELWTSGSEHLSPDSRTSM